MIIREYTLPQSVGYGLGGGLGWALAIVAMAGIRQKMATRAGPRGLEGAGITLIVAGIMALAFMGFNGMIGELKLRTAMLTDLPDQRRRDVRPSPRVLALLMVLADATIGNYGEVTITINERRELHRRGRPAAAGHAQGRGHLHPLGLRRARLLRPVQGARDRRRRRVRCPPSCPGSPRSERGRRCGCPARSRSSGDLRIAIPEELFSVRQYRRRGRRRSAT